MNKLDLKIAVRAFLKNKWYNILNISGLTLGLAAFVLVTLYIGNETSYDHWNKNLNRIFLLERELPDGASPYTPGALATAIKNQCPEVEEAGRINTALFQVPFYTPAGRFMVKKWVGADYSIASILGIKPEGFKLDPQRKTPTVLLSKKMAAALFPGDQNVRNKVVNMASKSGMPMTIAGVAEKPPGNTNFTFDCIGFARDITQGKDQSYATQIYQTYILVKPNADIQALSKKIAKIYKDAASADTNQVIRQAAINFKTDAIYLDPLANLHLRPHYGSHVNAQIVDGLVILALIILVMTGINFTSLYISQANRRAKEVGIKKVNGIIKTKLALQFLLEIFLQCLIAMTASMIVVVVGLPYFNELLQVNLSFSGINWSIISELLVILITLTLIAGIYPSLVMAGFKPSVVLRGDQLAQNGKLSWVRTGITVLQFAFAVGFIIILVVINRQVTFMQTESPGFTARQVLYIDNLGIYNNPKKFAPVSDRIKAIPGVADVTVASNIPGGIKPASHECTVQGQSYAMNTIGVGYNYFKTLNIDIKEGRAFNMAFPDDSANAIINETAAKAMNLKHPIGATINGCGGSYHVIGVINDVKAYGFEESTKPTIYLLHNRCGLNVLQIMIKAEDKAIPGILATLGRNWKNINKLDGDNFNYHFLDELYGRLFIKQEQLQAELTYFSILAICIASLGLFSLAAQSIRFRTREIAIRKVFGATAKQLMAVLSKPFFVSVLLANFIAWPFCYFIAEKWLNTFAYRTQLSFWPFLFAMAISTTIVVVTVCLQGIKCSKVQPCRKIEDIVNGKSIALIIYLLYFSLFSFFSGDILP